MAADGGPQPRNTIRIIRLEIDATRARAKAATIGSMSLVLYDTEMGDGSSLGQLSLLMKGESLPPGTRWEGIPAARC